MGRAALMRDENTQLYWETCFVLRVSFVLRLSFPFAPI